MDTVKFDSTGKSAGKEARGQRQPRLRGDDVMEANIAFILALMVVSYMGRIFDGRSYSSRRLKA
ncbi:MAG: hypothetical protein HZB68_02460 [Candidatus Aenigmarchaeota archaeon]|nr:hypothetical protein [Candidatus Aenigmarchaeota archaeon]